MNNSFDFDSLKPKYPIKFSFPQLCARCGQYSGERHKYCLVCVDKMKKNSHEEKINDDSVIGVFSSRTPRKRNPRNFRFGRIGDNLCIQCKTVERQINTNICLKCDAYKRELTRNTNTSYSLHSFGNAELILALSQSSSSLIGVGKKAETRCIVCRKRFTVDQSEMCEKCLNKSKQIMPIGRFYRDLDKVVKEAISVKDEFKSMEPIRGGISWEISFNARKESLKQLLNSVVIMRPKNKDEKEKHDDVLYYIKTLIDECTLHFERHMVRGDKHSHTARN